MPTESAIIDSFQYRLKDATGTFSTAATVSVSISAGGGGGGGGGGGDETCSGGGNVVCKGDDLALENGEQLLNLKILPPTKSMCGDLHTVILQRQVIVPFLC